MIVHIGYHKTGTSFLQQHVFPYIEGINYYDYRTCERLFKPVYLHTTIEFDAKKTAKRFDQDSSSLYSLERLVGEMGVGTYNYEIAERLKSIGFKKVIITIRKQTKMVESIYRQYIQQGGVLKPKAFLEDEMYFRWSYLDYYELISHYAELFGKQNVLVLLQEELATDPQVLLSKIKAFCDADKMPSIQNTKRGNISLSFLSMKLLRVINHFTNNYYRPSNLISNKITTWKFRSLLQKKIDPLIISRIVPDKPLIKGSSIKKVRSFYNAGNLKLQEEFGLKLEKHGYLVNETKPPKA